MDVEPDHVIDVGRFEIVNGRRVQLPPRSVGACLMTSELAGRLGRHAESLGAGQAVAWGLFRLPVGRGQCRRPAVAFVSRERWPTHRRVSETAEAWDVVPDLAVEIVCPKDLAEYLMGKVNDYIEAGVRLVWVVYPRLWLVHVFESFTSIRVLERADTLDGGIVLPDFRLPLNELLPERATP
jgi:Uma2 family endonuclease